MREYSNAFKNLGNGLYCKFIEIFNSGIVYYDAQEREFIETVRERYGLNIVFTDLSLYDKRATIRVYVDFQDNTCVVAEELDTILRSNEVIHLPLNDIIDTSSKAIQKFSSNLIDIFLEIFRYKNDDFTAINLYVEDFVRSFLARIHNVSLHDIRTYMNTTYGLTGIWRIITGYEPSITIVADDVWKYNRLLIRKGKIKKDCYAIMKGRDHFDLLTQDDVNILILLKSNLDNETQNRYARELL